MAVLWEKKQDGVHYQVRTAGASRRLYTNRVCHSQYNPNQILTGSIWDLLLLSAFLHPAENIERVLVLGVGGGAVLRQIQHFFQPKEIIGVELDGMHLNIAQRFFDLDKKNYRLEEGDAVAWLQQYRGEPFDLIIDDLFKDVLGQPVRAVPANSSWYEQLLSVLKGDGVLAMNFASRKEFRASAAIKQAPINHQFETIFQLTSPNLDNHVGVYLRSAVKSQELHARLENNPELLRALQSKRLRYRIRKLRRL